MSQVMIKKVAILGAGVMGAQIAAHCINARVPVILFDLPGKPDQARNALAERALEHLKKINPAPLAQSQQAELIAVANFEDDLEKLAAVDLIIEAIAERMDWKHALYEKIAVHVPPHTIFATNTSGLSITDLSTGLADDLRSRFCGVHFFNPPRYMHLVELIPTVATQPSILNQLESFLVTTLGKGVVRAIDTPNFIANRVGVFGMLAIMHEAEKFGLSYDVVDDLTGAKLGRAKSGTFRTADVVGLDTLGHVIRTMQDKLPDDPFHSVYATPAVLERLVAGGNLGQKSGAGFYKKIGKDMDKLKSSYRIFSRMACTFAFPEEIGSPYEDGMEILEKAEKDNELVDGLDMNYFNEENEKNMKKFDMLVKKTYLNKLDIGKQKYLSMENGSLERHSPKYFQMIKNIEKSPGCIFVYSQFITLIGLNTFCLALEATGKYCEFSIVKDSGNWVLNNKPEDDDKWKYVTWAGDKEKEEREILIKVFNGELDLLPGNCQILKTQLKNKYKNEMNKHGDVIRVFLTTKTGAEGISLFNVRQVHIMEPYWQPVLIDQVIGRAVRTGSHMTLPLAERNVEVYVYLATYSKEQLNLLKEPNLRGDVARFNDGLEKRGMIVTSDESLYIISERKRSVIDVLLKLIKEVSFDCNIHAKINYDVKEPFKCLDYDSKNRDEYLSAPSIMDTIGLAEENQEQNIQIAMGEFTVKGVKYYYELNTLPKQKKLFYNDTILGAGRAKPVGELIEKNGKTFPAFYKVKTDKNKSKSKSKKSIKLTKKNNLKVLNKKSKKN
jgi:3-hydroxyacyl-CoA dehydrogenase